MSAAELELLRLRFRAGLEANAGSPLSRAELLWLLLVRWSSRAGDAAALALLRAAVDVEGELALAEMVSIENRLEAAGRTVVRTTCQDCGEWATDVHLSSRAHVDKVLSAWARRRAAVTIAPRRRLGRKVVAR